MSSSAFGDDGACCCRTKFETWVNVGAFVIGMGLWGISNRSDIGTIRVRLSIDPAPFYTCRLIPYPLFEGIYFSIQQVLTIKLGIPKKG